MLNKKRLTRRQSAVKKLLKLGCFIRHVNGMSKRNKFRLMDENINPISFVNPRTVKALHRKEIIITTDGITYVMKG